METIQQIRCGSANCFLIRNDTAGILVDTGRERYRDAVLNACIGTPIRLIVLTHGHVDHVQNAAFLSKELHTPLAMHRDDIPLLEDNWQQPLSSSGYLGGLMLSATKRSFRCDKIPPFSPNVLLDHGDSLSFYGFDVRVVALPGHTRGSIGLTVGETSMIVGDAMMNLFRPRPSLLYHNRVMLLRSIRKIKALAPQTIYFGHGRPAQMKK